MFGKEKPSPSHRPLLSLVVPMYNERGGLEVFFGRVTPILTSITPDWEILCVDDGSGDGTFADLEARHRADPRIRALRLARNFGKEAALTAGLMHVQGQAVIPIDADLQDPPELIPELVAKWREGFKVVLATRRTRQGDGLLKRLTAGIFYRLLRRVSAVDIPANTGDFRLMDAQVVEVLRLLPERTRFMKGLFAWVGFTSAQVLYDRPARASGSAKQNVGRLWRLAKDGLFSFTTLPLQITTWLGLIISIFAFSYAAFLLLRVMLYGVDVPGYASTMAAVLCIGGIQLLSLGVIGEYIGRIYREAKHRPLYVVEREL